MRADKPIGSLLLLFPCLWSLFLAYTPQDSIYHTIYLSILFIIGAFVMRGAGCVYNDILDCEIDKKVARTANRPLPSGQITKKQAYVFLAILLAIGFAVLIQFNIATILWGISSLGLVVLYPLMKRITNYPQLWLGLTFNWGALLGWIALREELGVSAIFIYIAGIFWTLGYDTIYAHQDKKDDVLIGVKSTAITFGNKTKLFLSIFYSITISLFLVAGYMVNMGYVFYILMIFPTLHLAWQIKTLDINSSNSCLKKFQSNQWFGLIVLLLLFIEKYN